MGGRIRILASVALGLALVAGAVFVREDAVADTNLEDPRTFVAALPLREYQEPTDTDGDGLRDWLEELTGTDPEQNDALRIASSTASTGPFVVDTETERFALSFFEEMINQHGGDGLTPEETQAVLAKSMREFRTLNNDTLYTRADINIEEDTSVREYGNALATAILSHNAKPDGVEHELVILGRALETDDETLLQDITLIRKNYEDMVVAVKSVPVPYKGIDAHLLLLNSLQAIAADIKAFELAFSDPLVAFLRTKRYQEDAVTLLRSMEQVRVVLEDEAVVYRNEEPGQLFFSLRP